MARLSSRWVALKVLRCMRGVAKKAKQGNERGELLHTGREGLSGRE